MKTVLAIAGSDTCAGAGIQQDLKTVTALGHYAVTVVTALTAQNTTGVQSVMAVPADMLRAQLDSVLSDVDVAAVKIGMIPDAQSAHIIMDTISHVQVPIVCDPVMFSTSGTQLMDDECIDTIKLGLFPLCTLVTPNIPESERLLDARFAEVCDVGHMLVEHYGTSFLIKGGHSGGDMMTDRLYCADGSVREYTSPRIPTANLHGTGCTLSSAVAALLAEGRTLHDAVRGAKELVDKGIRQGRSLCIGKGNGPLWVL